MWNQNTLTEKIGICYPIIQAGMAGGITTPELVAAVSNAGGLGTLGAGYLSPEQTRENIQKIKQLTDKPFAVNLFTPEIPEVKDAEIAQANEWLLPFREELHITEAPKVKEIQTAAFEQQIQITIEEHVPVCSFTFGIPSEDFLQRLKENHIIVIGTATTVSEAKANEDSGMDMVVMQGSEAGGHRGTFLGSFEDAMIGTMALIPQAADQVNIPLIAAGGISDGRGVLASFILGAQGAQMGTAFLSCLESGANTQHKQAVLNIEENQLAITSAFSGKPARGIRNDFIKKMKKHEKHLPPYPIQNSLTKQIRSEAGKQNRTEWMSLWCGQNPRSCKSQSADELIASIVSQIENTQM
ncbi:NAD(P)H-dependent flavin oxidoreductase [Oceanobacillus neutriphilus]|uniref:Probable nitronate monooxygenase n=1 Tax=Oceanobacillus neutriphilus TaxID=531815 RepID=A0ABQ2NR38_9BACI|nr:nitronate monooxygenase [Oceanobacillus neutriphilus]GGP08243.1 putative nitronate monooxygenase [Oceanobacillus neutriphilus]